MSISLSFPDYLLFFIAIFNLILSVFIFVNDPKNKVNIFFALFAFFMSIWPVCLLLYRNVDLPFAHFWMRTSYIAAIGIAVSFWYFVHFFPKEHKLRFSNSTLPLLLTLGLIALFFDPEFISRTVVEFAGGERTVSVDQLGYYLFTSYFSFFFFGAIFLLWFRYRKTKKILKIHSRILLYSILFAGSFGVFFNLVLPSPFLGNFSYIHLGPFFTFFIVLSVAYGVAKYQLMSIKALLAEILIIGLILIQLIQVVIAKDFANVVISTAVLGAVLVIGFLLVRSVLNEVKRREEVSTLATSLKRANYRLKELDRQKTEFLSIASHQLRTPLSITKGYIELLQDGAFGKITSKTYNTLNEMDQSNERLVKLIDEFLDITRIEQGRTKYSFVDADMNNLISSVTSELDKRAKNTGISLIWKPRKNLNKVHMDEEKIRHVVFNFVDNAIKYSDKSKKGSVEVSVEKEKKGLSVRVVDNGLGFTRTDKENFFQKFYRGKNVQDLNINGTGLGLYVCRKFIETHKGNVWAKSAGRNKGSEFGFWVPIGKKS